MADVATPTSYAGQLSPSATGYLGKKWGLWSGTDVDEGQKGIADTLGDINRIIGYKGGSQISDIGQLDNALAPLIAKRNKSGLSGALGGILKVAAPIALSLLMPGLGTAIGAGLGAGTGALGSALGGAIVGAGTSGLTSALTGGKVLKDTLTGGVTGGIGGGIQGATAGKVLATSGPLQGQMVTPGVSSAVAQSGPLAGQAITPSIGSGIGTSIGSYSPDILQKAVNFGANVNDKIGNIGNQVASAVGLPTSAAKTTGGITMNNPLTSALSGFMEYKTQNDIAEKLKKSQLAALQQITPYTQTGASANQQLAQALAAGFNPGDLSEDAGYQFRLGQGQKALGQSLAARGMGQSGAALKAAQEYGQNLANQEYNDAYNRWLSQNSQLNSVANRGYTAASEAGDIMSNIGAVGAQGIAGRNNAVSSTLVSLLSGRGIIGFDNMKNPIYG